MNITHRTSSDCPQLPSRWDVLDKILITLEKIVEDIRVYQEKLAPILQRMRDQEDRWKKNHDVRLTDISLTGI